VLVLLVLGAVVQAPGHSSFVLLTGMNRLDYMLAGTSIAAIGNLGLSILLTWQVGVVGPVLGSLAAWVAWDLLLLPRRVGTLLRIPWTPLSAGGVRELALPVIAGSLVALVAVAGFGWSSPGAALVGTAIVGVVYITALWLTLAPPRRTRYQRLLAGALTRRASGR
jgi:hypothetical protein